MTAIERYFSSSGMPAPANRANARRHRLTARDYRIVTVDGAPERPRETGVGATSYGRCPTAPSEPETDVSPMPARAPANDFTCADPR